LGKLFFPSTFCSCSEILYLMNLAAGKEKAGSKDEGGRKNAIGAAPANAATKEAVDSVQGEDEGDDAAGKVAPDARVCGGEDEGEATNGNLWQFLAMRPVRVLALPQARH
jgi:hypothetical protein